MEARIFAACLLWFVIVGLALAQDYQDYASDPYAGDNLYTDYANRQAAKADGAPGGGGGMVKMVATFGAGWLLGGKFHSGRATKKLKKKHMKEQKALYTQYYNDVYQLQETIVQLETSLKQVKEQAELDALQRDYDEFKQPDVDGDDRISRAEFNMYVKNYLANYPGLQEKDYPKFEDFDHDKDGFVSFQEYAQQMALQVQQAELENYYKQQQGQKVNSAAAQGLQGLYKEASKTDNFNDLYSNLRKV